VSSSNKQRNNKQTYFGLSAYLKWSKYELYRGGGQVYSLMKDYAPNETVINKIMAVVLSSVNNQMVHNNKTLLGKCFKYMCQTTNKLISDYLYI
jgi:hypothetical protein